MKMRSKGQQMIAASCLAVMAYLALYLFLRPELPERLVRHAGADGAGYSHGWWCS
ncbi:hypothetical protein [Glutamicibacter nicotianae]|uniref:hypothetical protein n=1 Tax=Glutamicibacter nicotianae TaxID=37929 RepID=UPI002557AAB3|nr:hypothetical protein [Glutamicibacter nicotianae]WIV44132.1 hypothetical protein QQS42_00480 [Glutamicibacter nicotianae]